MKKIKDVIQTMLHAKKFVLDSLVESGTFPGDGQRYVLGFIDHFRVDSKNPRIEITIHEDNDK